MMRTLAAMAVGALTSICFAWFAEADTAQFLLAGLVAHYGMLAEMKE